MLTVLRAVRLFAVVLWVGGIAFFAFVMAPVAFSRLPSPHEAGMVVRGAIGVLHWIGIACGGLLVAATLLLRGRAAGRARRGLGWQVVLGVAMVGVTLASQAGVLPAMERDRIAAADGAIESFAPTDARRIEFERLHALSEKMEGAVLLLGFGVLILMAREDGRLV